MVNILLLDEPCLQVKVHLHQDEAKANISFDVCHFSLIFFIWFVL